MWWLFVLGAVLAVVLLAVLTGVKPSGTRTVANTRLMGIAKIVLGIMIIVLVLLALR